MATIRISWSNGEVTASLKETPTTLKLLEALPFHSNANTWGDEVYFRIHVETLHVIPFYENLDTCDFS
jgi:hypothetical protein